MQTFPNGVCADPVLLACDEDDFIGPNVPWSMPLLPFLRPIALQGTVAEAFGTVPTHEPAHSALAEGTGAVKE